MSSPGRPEKPIDWIKVDDLLEAGCNATQIAPHFNIHPDTLCNRVRERYDMLFSDYLALKVAKGDSDLLNAQHVKARSGDNTMMVWMGKQRLKQRENPTESTVSKEIVDSFSAVMDQMTKMQKAIKEDLDKSES